MAAYHYLWGWYRYQHARYMSGKFIFVYPKDRPVGERGSQRKQNIVDHMWNRVGCGGVYKGNMAKKLFKIELAT